MSHATYLLLSKMLEDTLAQTLGGSGVLIIEILITD